MKHKDFEELHTLGESELITRIWKQADEIDELQKRDEVWRNKKALLENSLATTVIEVSNLRCCGNCIRYHYCDGKNLCDDWKNDGETKEVRTGEVVHD